MHDCPSLTRCFALSGGGGELDVKPTEPSLGKGGLQEH
jgi:hypothetical protein